MQVLPCKPRDRPLCIQQDSIVHACQNPARRLRTGGPPKIAGGLLLRAQAHHRLGALVRHPSGSSSPLQRLVLSQRPGVGSPPSEAPAPSKTCWIRSSRVPRQHDNGHCSWHAAYAATAFDKYRAHRDRSKLGFAAEQPVGANLPRTKLQTNIQARKSCSTGSSGASETMAWPHFRTSKTSKRVTDLSFFGKSDQPSEPRARHCSSSSGCNSKMSAVCESGQRDISFRQSNDIGSEWTSPSLFPPTGRSTSSLAWMLTKHSFPRSATWPIGLVKSPSSTAGISQAPEDCAATPAITRRDPREQSVTHNACTLSHPHSLPFLSPWLWASSSPGHEGSVRPPGQLAPQISWGFQGVVKV